MHFGGVERFDMQMEKKKKKTGLVTRFSAIMFSAPAGYFWALGEGCWEAAIDMWCEAAPFQCFQSRSGVARSVNGCTVHPIRLYWHKMIRIVCLEANLALNFSPHRWIIGTISRLSSLPHWHFSIQNPSVDKWINDPVIYKSRPTGWGWGWGGSTGCMLSAAFEPFEIYCWLMTLT